MFQKTTLNLHTKIHSIRRIGGLLTEFIIHSPKLIKTIDIGEFIKFQNYAKDKFYLSEPVPLTPVYLDYDNALVHFIIKERGASSRILSRLDVGEKVVAMGALGEKFPMGIFENRKVLVICQGFIHYFNLFLMEKIFETTATITLVSDNLNQIDEFYRLRLKQYCHKLIDCEGHQKKFQDFLVNSVRDFDCVVLGLKNCNLKNQIYGQNTIIVDLRNSIMQCMLNGVCGRCLQHDALGEPFFACGKSRYVIYDENASRDFKRKNAMNSLSEKIAHAKSKILIVD